MDSLSRLFICITILFFSINTTYSKYNWKRLEKSEKKWNRRQPHQKIFNFIPISKGMIVGEVGAGYGRYTVHLSNRVGDSGKVYANDVTDKAINVLKERILQYNIKNIIPIKGQFHDPLFPVNNLDCIFTINTYHHIDRPVAFIKQASKYLKEQGIFAIVEHPPEVFVKEHSTPRKEIINHFKQNGFELIKEDHSLKYDVIYVFKRIIGQPL